MQIKGSQFSSIEQITGQYLQKNNKNISSNDSQVTTENFQTVLAGKVGDTGSLRFSRHANERLDSRRIILSDEQMQRLEDGAKRAGEKGIRESLVLVDSLAFIVNTKQNTVITAMNQEETSEHVYTNIDGAVIT